MKRYCIFVANYLPNLGGVERYTLNLGRELIAAGNEVTVVTSNVFNLPAKETIDGINIFRLPCWNVLNGRFPVLKYNGEFKSLNKELEHLEFDFVIVQTRFYVHSFYGTAFAKKKAIPCITIEHGTNHFTVNNPVLDFFGEIYEHIITAAVKANCKDFYGVSQNCCKWIQHFDIQARGVLYNAVDLCDIQQKLEHADEQKFKSNIDANAKIVTYTGRLIKEKGLLKLIDAVTKLRESGLDVLLMVAGDGELMPEIEQKGLEYVKLLGKLDFQDVISLLKVSDVFCLPTDYPEGFPTSVLEAAACKAYVVTTTNGGSKELILDESYGTVLSDNTVDNIEFAIRRALTDSDYRTNAAAKAYDRLCSEFTWKRTADNVIKIAQSMENAK